MARVRGNASSASLLSSFSMFCRDQLHLRAALTMRAVRVFKTAPGTAAGVVALHTGRELDMLFRAKRQHLRADCGVSIEPNRTRAERLACAIARRARRVTPSLRRSGAAEDSSDVAGQQLNCSPRSRASRSTLRADAPEFVPLHLCHSMRHRRPALLCRVCMHCIRNRGGGVGARLAMSGPLTARSPCSS